MKPRYRFMQIRIVAIFRVNVAVGVYSEDGNSNVCWNVWIIPSWHGYDLIRVHL